MKILYDYPTGQICSWNSPQFILAERPDEFIYTYRPQFFHPCNWPVIVTFLELLQQM